MAKTQRTVTYVSGHLVDLDVDNHDAFDGSIARVKLVSKTHANGTVSTTARLKLRNVQADEGTVFGSHIHTGPCVECDGAAAGPHFNITTYNEQEPVISPETEIWLDFSVKRNGRGTSRSTVYFLLPDAAAQSIVIHEMATNPDGGAGARLAYISI